MDRVKERLDAAPVQAPGEAWAQWRKELDEALTAFHKTIGEEVFGAFKLCDTCMQRMLIVHAQLVAELAAVRASPGS